MVSAQSTIETVKRFYTPDGPASYFRLLRPPPGSTALELPAPGIGNSCERGEVRVARWSPDGLLLVAEVQNRSSITLCLYDLSLFRPDTSDGLTVRVLRVSASGLWDEAHVETSSRSRRNAVSWSDREATWARHTSAPAKLVFVRDNELVNDRLYGLTDAALHETGLGAIVFEPDTERLPYQTTMPVWANFPPFPGGVSPLAVTSNHTSPQASTCGRSSIQLLTLEANNRFQYKPLSDPCEELTAAERARGNNSADRYPAWSPSDPNGRLAFIRVDAGANYRLCVIRDVFSTPRSSCHNPVREELRQRARKSPVWDERGRYVALFASQAEKGGGHPSRNSIEVYDQQNPSGEPTFIVDDVRPSDWQEPALGRFKNSIRLYYILDKADEPIKGILRYMPLDAGATSTPLQTGLMGLTSVISGREKSVDWLAIIARGYQGVTNADVSRDRIFLMRPSTP